MRLLEYEAKEILRQYQISTPAGHLVISANSISIGTPVVLKAQIPVGGRGKAGGILDAFTTEEAKTKAQQLLSASIKGYNVSSLLLEEKIDISEEFFISIIYDTVSKRPVAIFSPEGGVDIEDAAVHEPEKVRKERFSVRSGFPLYKARALLSEAGIGGKLLLVLSRVLSRLASFFLDYDATIVEINPLGLTPDGQLVALDCHVEIDDDALFRHSDLAEKAKDLSIIRKVRESTDFERQAAAVDGLDHRGVAGRVIEFDGSLGLIIGGGGGSLTAFDAIQMYGGRPANYCEIGGNPSVKKVKELTKLILSKRNVKKIAVIMNIVNNTRADLVARGVIKGTLETGKVPSKTISVFRVPGAWEHEALKVLTKYNVQYFDRTTSIDEAAKIAAERSAEKGR